MVDTPSQWIWSSWHYMIGKTISPPWLATDSILSLFSHNREDAIKEYSEFVFTGKGISIWEDLRHQVFLGSDEFVEKYQPMQDELNGDLKEIPLKQRRKPALTLLQYQQQSSSRDEAIVLSYQSGGYTLKDIGDHFRLHYSRVSRIIAKGKT